MPEVRIDEPQPKAVTTSIDISSISSKYDSVLLNTLPDYENQSQKILNEVTTHCKVLMLYFTELVRMFMCK